ncbi:hypothetical protein HanRHA438_Chr17g0791301 [Helianthus annuus]|uniref:Uncharacterized protein n=1 Tax=Helianthus annuus TaxID=4232 RepID=A0A251RL21_HELAN|nr:hypothetical protein HanXRQr2_Chr17g0780751 [Helianthus annuus]KAJ0431385.1 hypothetical protein HanIR_Chr17g0847801 [Helianthus annuus]KAJ0445854.1 hypothetical protein HanHA89_Chr17g0687971 [Helianthus annuus]KAJ0630820.1 hypothetical protein HanLR1_Chr17g0647371 [Helianthus annuus]KAJ0634679.1 hypothetical protein HanOQP8_Chr17g0642641 [Helianthus annuus]
MMYGTDALKQKKIKNLILQNTFKGLSFCSSYSSSIQDYLYAFGESISQSRLFESSYKCVQFYRRMCSNQPPATILRPPTRVCQ